MYSTGTDSNYDAPSYDNDPIGDHVYTSILQDSAVNGYITQMCAARIPPGVVAVAKAGVSAAIGGAFGGGVMAPVLGTSPLAGAVNGAAFTFAVSGALTAYQQLTGKSEGGDVSNKLADSIVAAMTAALSNSKDRLSDEWLQDFKYKFYYYETLKRHLVKKGISDDQATLIHGSVYTTVYKLEMGKIPSPDRMKQIAQHQEKANTHHSGHHRYGGSSSSRSKIH
jgi:hypothetical protein